MSEAIIFKKCLGFTDSSAIATQQLDPKTGETALTSVTNMTVTPDGCLQTAPKYSTVATHSKTITGLSASSLSSRLLVRDATAVNEWTGTALVQRFASDGPVSHTKQDVRASLTAGVYKSANPSGTAVAATTGTYPNATSISFSAMPKYQGASQYLSRLVAINSASPQFLQYSEPWRFDLWDYGNAYREFRWPIKQFDHVPNSLVALHDYGITVCAGGDIAAPDFTAKFYQCAPVNNTLASGYINGKVAYAHIFLCSNGLYVVTTDGVVTNATDGVVDNITALNTSYSGAVIVSGKYLAFGNLVTVVYDFDTKTFMLWDGGLIGGCVWHGGLYTATGTTLQTLSTVENDSGACAFTLPYSTLGAIGRKSFSDLYLTGEISGTLEIAVKDQSDPDEPEQWRIEVDSPGVIQNYRVKLPRHTVGSKIAFEFAMSGYLRLEEARVVFTSGART